MNNEEIIRKAYEKHFRHNEDGRGEVKQAYFKWDIFKTVNKKNVRYYNFITALKKEYAAGYTAGYAQGQFDKAMDKNMLKVKEFVKEATKAERARCVKLIQEGKPSEKKHLCPDGNIYEIVAYTKEEVLSLIDKVD
jgi:hypothetical protein